MQYVKQLANGNRVRMTEEQHNEDSFNKNYLKIINASTMIIYRVHRGDNSPKIGKPLRYGGRNRGGQHLAWNGC